MRSVWVFARPRSKHSNSESAVATGTSDGEAELCYWAVLVTELNVDNIKSLALRRNNSMTDEIDLGDYIHVGNDIDLGPLWELRQVNSTVSVQDPFKLSMMQDHWASFAGEFVGTTTLTNEEIQIAGIFVIITD